MGIGRGEPDRVRHPRRRAHDRKHRGLRRQLFLRTRSVEDLAQGLQGGTPLQDSGESAEVRVRDTDSRRRRGPDNPAVDGAGGIRPLHTPGLHHPLQRADIGRDHIPDRGADSSRLPSKL